MRPDTAMLETQFGQAKDFCSTAVFFEDTQSYLGLSHDLATDVYSVNQHRDAAATPAYRFRRSPSSRRRWAREAKRLFSLSLFSNWLLAASSSAHAHRGHMACT